MLAISQPADPRDVGESWSAHQWLSRLSERVDLTVLSYRKRGKMPIADDLPGARVIEWQDPPMAGRFERFNALAKPGWFTFHRAARKWIRAALQRGERFDLAHQISPLALRYPSPAAGLVGPFIVGPLGGSVPTPEGFEHEFTADSWYVRLRAFDRLLLTHAPGLKRTFGSADCVLGVADYVCALLADAGHPPRRFEIESETGVLEMSEDYERAAPEAGKLKLLFVGRLVRTKGVRDAVRAMAKLGDLPGVTLDIVGDGDDRAACEAEARDAGLIQSGRVTFHGRKPREVVNDFYRAADVFFFPSLREPSGNVVLESMGHGLPLIAADAGGPGSVVTAECGLKVRPQTPEQFSDGLAEAVRTLANSPERVVEMGRACRQEVERRHLWSGKIDRMMAVYRSVLQDSDRTDTASGTAAHKDGSPQT